MEKITFRTLCLGLILISTSALAQNGPDFLGRVLYHNNYPMSGVSAYLHLPDGTVIDTAVTDNQGYYEFDNLSDGNYTVTFNTNETAGGIELSDAFLVMMRLFNLVTFTSVQNLAADVNGSGNITWADYFMILIGYLNQGNPFPIGPWVFENTPITIPDGSREGVTTKAGSSSGDVNGSLVPDPKRNEILLENQYVDFASDNSEPFNFSLTTGQELRIKGMHLSFKVPGNLEIVDYETLIPEANIFFSDDRITITWIDESLEGFELGTGAPLIVIHARAKGISRPGERYSIVLDDRSHFIDQNGEVILGARLSLPVISLVSSNEAKQTAYPNPFVKQVTFDYNLPEDNHVIVMVIDLSGRLVLEINDSNTHAGRHQVKADCSALKPGLYQYVIKTSGNNQVIANGTIIKSN